MGRYIKNKSKYILAKYHQAVEQGRIYERDWTTIGNAHRLEPGKRPFYGSSNFLFTENVFPAYKKKRKSGKWVGNYTYDDVKDASELVNLIKVNTDSDNLTDYAYWGSMLELFRGSVEHIISTFPGGLRATKLKFQIHHHSNDENGGVEYWADAPGYILSNPFKLDMHSQFEDVTSEEILRYVALSWKNYVMENYDEGYGSVYGLTTYEITPESIQYDCEGRYYKICNIMIFCGKYSFVVDTYLADGEIVYCYRDNEETVNFLITYHSGIAQAGAAYVPEEVVSQSNANNYVVPESFAIRPNDAIIEDYFRSLEGFEWKLLNRSSKPLYRNAFLYPKQTKSGKWHLVKRTYTWPSYGYCIDVESMSYTSFINSMMDICEAYDNLWCDSIWRCMTHEAIKNFDWSYRREYDDNDLEENVDGGNRMRDVLRLYGLIYDNAKRYVDGISMTPNVTYDGYNNCPEAQISDRNTLIGWDICSTQHSFFWYEEVVKEQGNDGYVSLPVLPVNVDEDSPEDISVDCEGMYGTKYYKKRTLLPSDTSLDEVFFNEASVVDKQANPWVSTNAYEQLYIEVPYGDVPSGYSFTNCTYNEFPYQLFDDDVHFPNGYPQYVKVVANGKMDRYYKLSDESDIEANNENFVNDTWFATRNENYVNTGVTDILFNKMLNLSSNRIMKTKGTKEAIEMAFALFGFGLYDPETNPCGDFVMEERYWTVDTKGYDERFYFYEEVNESEVPNPESMSAIYEIPADPDENSTRYIKVERSNGDETTYIKYYRLNGEYTVSEAIKALFAHRTTERIYDDVYSGVPVKDIYSKREHLIVPFMDSSRNYEGDVYFQSKGGWMKNTENTNNSWEYSETIPYLHIIQRISDLLSVSTNGLNENDIYFVADVSDYYAYSDITPYYLSNFFKIRDKYNPSMFYSWINIPMDGEIRFSIRSGDASREDYLHAKHLDEIIPSILFNNPHCGYDAYDCGMEYMKYMERPYSYSAENYLYDDDYYANMASQFHFAKTKVSQEKEQVTADTYNYENNGRTDTPSSVPFTLNDKFLLIRLVDSNGDGLSITDSTKRMHMEYMRNVVMKYVAQVVPSTTLLVLDNFVQEEPTLDSSSMVVITVVASPSEGGTAIGGGTYLKTTMVTLRAIPNEGYHFLHWTYSSERASYISNPEPEITVMACSEKTYTAVFEEDCGISFGCKEVNCGSTPAD